MDYPLVSVIIPSYNQADFIDEAIGSVLNQQYANLEIIVVDDGSTDNTKCLLEKYQSKITYIFQENKGPSSARNRGLICAKGEYIAFLDADDLWTSQKLNLQIQAIREDNAIGIVGCGFYVIDKTGKIVKTWVPKKYRDEDSFLSDLRIRNIFGNPSVALMRRECLEKVGVFKEHLRFGEDWDMWLRVAKLYKLKMIDIPLVKFRKHFENKGYKKVKTIESNVKRIIEDNLDSKKRVERRKAYSYMYVDLSRLCMSENKTLESMYYVMKSFLSYPLKVSSEDLKYVMAMRFLHPKTFRKKAQKICQ